MRKIKQSLVVILNALVITTSLILPANIAHAEELNQQSTILQQHSGGNPEPR